MVQENHLTHYTFLYIKLFLDMEVYNSVDFYTYMFQLFNQY